MQLIAQIQRGAGGPAPPLKNHKFIGFLSNTGPEPQKKHKATKPTFNIGPSSARWWADNGPLLVVFESFLPSLNEKKKLLELNPHGKTF